MFKRQKTGSVVCPSCGQLVGVRDKQCYNCGRRNPGLWGFGSLLRRAGNNFEFVSIMIWGCITLYVISLLIDPRGIQMRGWEMLSPSNRALFIMGASGAAPVFGYGRWWTVLSAAWLHGGLLHIAFNLLWVRQLAPAVSELYGPSRSVILYTFASITGFLLSSLAGLLLWNSPIPFLRGAMLTIGASAPIFGLLGALVVYGRRTGNSHISGQAMTYAIVIFVFGFILPGIDNFAHLGGFLGGYAGALLLNPLRSERTDHLIGAIICLVLTVLSVLISVVTAPQI